MGSFRCESKIRFCSRRKPSLSNPHLLDLHPFEVLMDFRRKGENGSHRGQHRCLNIPEILDLIFSHLPWSPLRSGDPTLAALARTCTAFHEPAIQHLWNQLYDLRPVVSLLPKRAWKMAEEPQEGWVLVSPFYPPYTPRLTLRKT
jgi:hypothetical protein